jgi:hypothetical protein
MAGRVGLGHWLGFLGPIDARRGLALTRTILTRFFDAFLCDGPPFSPADFARADPEVTVDSQELGRP